MRLFNKKYNMSPSKYRKNTSKI
ncbi:hypothetical protein M1K27_03980 [Clostridioides difficile]|nr:hypothetical protein [Clostridioides difficile]MCD8619605.1 hypothetical protein [Clostridioides difficile]MCD8623862.1 hypothetical protein [Clostridioides difficile]MCD8627387.1 hypothetical protein [Clostridioides difficile]MCD8630284.1 hypothetical protein [Clostridioides difficile]